MKRPRSAIVWLAALGGACSGVQRADDWHEHLGAPAPAVHGSGPFDAMVPDGIWGVGDRVVHAIAVEDGERTLRFTFELTTIALPGPDRGLSVVHPVHGRILTRTARVQMSRGTETVASGPARVRARLVGDDGTDCGGELDAELLAHWHADSLESFGAMSGVTELFGALLRLDCMHAALLRVLRPPSPWSVARRFGAIEVGLVFVWQRDPVVVERDTPFGRLPTVWQPFTITANGQPALDGRIEFTWKHAPLLLGAGVLRVEAWHPDEPSRRLTLRLDSAVRGTPPDAPDPDDLTEGLRRGRSVVEAARALGRAAARLRATRNALIPARAALATAAAGRSTMTARRVPRGPPCVTALRCRRPCSHSVSRSPVPAPRRRRSRSTASASR